MSSEQQEQRADLKGLAGALLLAVSVVETLLGSFGLNAWGSASIRVAGLLLVLWWLQARVRPVLEARTKKLPFSTRSRFRTAWRLGLFTCGMIGGGIIGSTFGSGPNSAIRPFIAAVDPVWRLQHVSTARVAGWPERPSDTAAVIPSLDVVLQFTNRGVSRRTLSELHLIVQRFGTPPTDTVGSVGYLFLNDSIFNGELVLDAGESRRLPIRFFYPKGWREADIERIGTDTVLAGPMESYIVDALGAKRWSSWTWQSLGRDRFYAQPLFPVNRRLIQK
jgi:hypothetical protein